ncbi:MAG: O-antigen ligase family protein [Ignavibacteria bacterium]|nr:O-antigen ligase family protein [Ignavibacteria bacterium]
MSVWVDRVLIFFLGLAVITSQWSIAASSIGVGGVVILVAVRLFFKRDFRFDETFFWLFGLFIISQIISSLLADDYLKSLSDISRRIPLYIIFIAPLIILADRDWLVKFLAVFFIFTGIICIIEIVRFLIDYNPSVPLSAYRLEYFGYPLTNGAVKMLIILMIIPFILTKEKFILNRIILIVITFLLLFTFYLTNSRNAFLGLTTGLMVYGFICNRKFLFSFLTVIILLLIFLPYSYKERILSISDLNHPSNKSRLVMWDTGIRIISDSPVFGHGDVDMKKLYSDYKTPEFHGEGSHMHSNFIQLLVNFGLFGFLSWAALMIYILLRQIKIIRLTHKDEFLKTISVISLCSMIAFQISGITEWNFGDAEFAVVMWFNLSLAFLAERIYKND